jgi:ribosomal protein S18 acetylase RimI-like enzyme
LTDAPALRRAIAANHRAWFRRGAATRDGCVERPAGIELAAEPPWGTIAFPGPRARSAVRLDLLIGRARELGLDRLSCWSLDEDPVLEALLVARRFEVGWQPRWMALELDHLPRDAALRHEVVAFAPGSGDRLLPYTSTRADPARTHHLAVRAGGQNVGHVVVNPWRGFAGIYNMGVADEHRRQGIGRSLTLAACRLGRRLGCSHAILNATPEGELLYRTVGFESLGMGRTWWLHPEHCSD